MKTCKNCGETKPLEGFPKHPGAFDGVSQPCKACKHEYQRQHRIAQRDKHADPLVSQFNQMAWK